MKKLIIGSVVAVSIVGLGVASIGFGENEYYTTTQPNSTTIAVEGLQTASDGEAPAAALTLKVGSYSAILPKSTEKEMTLKAPAIAISGAEADNFIVSVSSGAAPAAPAPCKLDQTFAAALSHAKSGAEPIYLPKMKITIDGTDCSASLR